MSLLNSSQRTQIQETVDLFFGRRVDIAPRAMAALQGRWRARDVGDGCYYTFPLSVFEALLTVSPTSLTLLFEAGVAVEKLFSTTSLDSSALSPLPVETLEDIFHGLRREDFTLPPLCKAGQQILETAKLSEIDLLRAFLQTAYTGPRTFSEKVDVGMYTTDVGDRLQDVGFVNSGEVVEEWDGGYGSYRALSGAAERYLNLAEKAESIQIADPSHDLFQFALWLDANGSIRVRPFGVGTLGTLAPTYLQNNQSFVFREGIFQPRSSFPPFKDDVIALFEDMLNAQTCSENDFQQFFSKHPYFLEGLDYKQIHPQLALYNENGSKLVPDFMLEPMSSDFCDLLELKLPYEHLVRRLRNQNRVRFRSLINEAVSQLNEYRRYFESKQNREEFHKQYGLSAYRPKMILVIGRRNHFRSDVERLDLRELLPKDLEIWTYDDLLNRALKYQSCAAR